ncbi:MAG: LacI family DNA-binding transcriptional regulator [Spirochaetia bacterium]|nr:LacI family DNA-binding transcriptional regulator [Spirochaetia bacterium]
MAARATIYDVAARAGVSIATVSRVLNEPAKVQESTRAAVLAVMRELGFVPRAEAVARARTRFRRIAVLVPFFTEPSFSQRLRGVSDALSAASHELVIYAVKSQAALEEYVDLVCAPDRVDGVILISLKLPGRSLDCLRKSGLPCVFIEAGVEGFDAVAVDNRQGGRMAARWLLELGFRRVAFVGEHSSQPFAVNSTDERLQGFLEAFEEAGVPVDERLVHVAEYPKGAGFAHGDLEAELAAVIGDEPRPEAIFATSDLIAARLAKIANGMGLSVPRDLALLGFDDVDLAEYLGLSTISQALDESGRLAASMLLERIERPDSPPRTSIIGLEIVRRGSVPRALERKGETKAEGGLK